MVLKIIIAIVLIAIVIAVAAVAIHLMNKKEDERIESIPTFDFNFDGKCHCEHCEHNNEKGDE